MEYRIENIHARRIISSKGRPSIETAVTLSDGSVGIGQAGISDGGSSEAAIRNVNDKLFPILKGRSADNVYSVDSLMLSLDGGDDSPLGNEATLSVSEACCDASAKAHKMPLYRFIGGISGATLPIPMMTVLSGSHPDSCADVKEFMIMPMGAAHYSDGLKRCCEVYSALGDLLKSRRLSAAAGDEGGYTPNISADSEALELILDAIAAAGFKAGKEFRIALNADACSWKTDRAGSYKLPKSARSLSSDAIIDHWKTLFHSYPIVSIEDPLADDDREGWARLTSELGSKVQLVGGKLFSTDCRKLFKGIEAGAANAVLVKLSQAGAVSSAIDCVKNAKNYGMRPIIANSPEETESSFIADFAVAINSGQIKIGAPSHGERTAKYNRLLRIEEELRSI